MNNSRSLPGKALVCDKGALEKNSVTSQLYNAALIPLNSHAYSDNESIIYGNACNHYIQSVTALCIWSCNYYLKYLFWFVF